MHDDHLIGVHYFLFLHFRLRKFANAEIVQEKAQEKEQQREQVVEVEKEEFVDRMYCRDHEEPTRWPFESLKQDAPPPNFYPANACALHMRRPIGFPDYMYVSDNYFDKRWSGDRFTVHLLGYLRHK